MKVLTANMSKSKHLNINRYRINGIRPLVDAQTKRRSGYMDQEQ